MNQTVMVFVLVLALCLKLSSSNSPDCSELAEVTLKLWNVGEELRETAKLMEEKVKYAKKELIEVLEVSDVVDLGIDGLNMTKTVNEVMLGRGENV